jgi:hypothetical protein
MTNIVLIMAALLMQHGPGPGVGERLNPDRFRGVTPVTDKFILPPKIPDCRTKEEADQAVADKRAGEWEKCDPERFIRAHGS